MCAYVLNVPSASHLYVRLAYISHRHTYTYIYRLRFMRRTHTHTRRTRTRTPNRRSQRNFSVRTFQSARFDNTRARTWMSVSVRRCVCVCMPGHCERQCVYVGSRASFDTFAGDSLEPNVRASTVFDVFYFGPGSRGLMSHSLRG